MRDDRLAGVRLADGRVVGRSVLFVEAGARPRDTLTAQLGARTQDTPFGPYPAVDAAGRTSVPGVWAVGNAAGPKVQVINAAAAGYQAGLMINQELILHDIDEGVAARRAVAGVRA